MPATAHGWLTAGTESPANQQDGFCCHQCCRHKSQALTRASILQWAYQSLTHSPPPWLTALAATKNDIWSCWILSVYSWRWVKEVELLLFFSFICGWVKTLNTFSYFVSCAYFQHDDDTEWGPEICWIPIERTIETGQGKSYVRNSC